MKINNEQAYPIYSFTFKWTQKGEHNPEYPKWHEGLAEGRIHNSTQFYKMYKEEKTDDELNVIAKGMDG